MAQMLQWRRRRRRRIARGRGMKKEKKAEAHPIEADRRKHPIGIIFEMSPTDLSKKKCVFFWPLMHDRPSCLSTGDRGSNQRRRPGDSFPANAWFDFQTLPTGGCACILFFIPSDWLVSELSRNAIISGPGNYSPAGQVNLSVWVAPSIKLQTVCRTCSRMVRIVQTKILYIIIHDFFFFQFYLKPQQLVNFITR